MKKLNFNEHAQITDAVLIVDGAMRWNDHSVYEHLKGKISLSW